MPRKLNKIAIAIFLTAVITGMVLMLKAKGIHKWVGKPTDPVSTIVALDEAGKPDVVFATSKTYKAYTANLAATSTDLAQNVTQAVEKKENFLVDIKAEDIKPSFQYAYKDLNIKPDKNVDLKAYAAELAKAFKPYGEISLEYVPVMALAALQTQDPKDVQPLTVIKISMIQRAKILAAAPTPESAKVLHISVVNSLLFLGELIYNMEKVTTEPILALESGQRYTVEYFRLINTLSLFNQYFVEKGVKFSEEEQVPFKLPGATTATSTS